MIARTFSRAIFSDLASYLARGRDGQHPERVAWTTGRELPDDDPDLAAIVMEATAERSRKVQYPCYHVVVAWDLNDHPTPPQMEAVIDILTDNLGLAQHQRLLVAHNDRPHPHVHFMLNRVHPHTGKAWERWRDRLTVERTLREQERVHAWREVPGRLSRTPDQERLATRNTAQHRPLSRAAQTLLDRARALTGQLRRVARWTDLEVQLAKEGLILERQGRALAISDGHATIPTTRLHPDLTLTALERRFADRYPEPEAAPNVRDIATHLHTLQQDRTLHANVLVAEKSAMTAEATLAHARRAKDATAVTTATHSLDAARAQLRAAKQSLATHRDRAIPVEELEHTIGLAMNRLLPAELRELRSAIEVADFSTAMTLKSQTREQHRDQDRAR